MPAPTPPSTSSNVSPKRHTIATPPGAPATTYATISPRHRLAGTSDTPLRPKQHPRRVVMAEMEPPRRVQSVDDNDRAIDSVDCDKTSGIPAPPRSTSLHHTLTAHLPQHPHSIHDHAPQHAPHHRSAQPRDGSVSCHARLDQCLAQDQLSEAISVASSVGEEKALFDRLLQSNRLTGGAGAGAGAGAAGGVEVDGRDRMSPDNRADLAGSLTSDTITSCSSSSSTLSGDDNEPLVIVEVGDRGYEYRGRDGRGHDLEVGGHGVERPLLGKQVSNGRLVVQHN